MEYVLPLINIAILVLVIGRVVLRQLTWQSTGGRAFRLPLILLVIGGALSSQDIASLAGLPAQGWIVVCLELLTGLGIGVAMGYLTQLRRGPAGIEYRGGALGVALWVALIAARIGEALIGQHFGGPALGQLTGLILLMVGLNRLTAAAVVSRRASAMSLTPQYA
ncbi:hypothetical protein [Naumannella huperziae]